MGSVNIVVGGGRFGCKAVEYLLRRSEPFIVIDEDRNCHVTERFPLLRIGLDAVDDIDLSKNYLIEGGVESALIVVEKLKPKRVFPTAPIHVAALLVKEKYNMGEWREAVEFLTLRLPPSIVVSVGRATVVTSYNKNAMCQPACAAPDVCPVTGFRRPHPMYELLKMAAPEGVILRSYQLEPGLGALDGGELLKALEMRGRGRKVVIGTACECHGVVTALKGSSSSPF
ncbi:MAG: hypothetical protein KIH01_07035 [Candidatus Freyarchaeota archaeon]|nr:hypothetical protein [Candidatus Jordarchaeia archaeon]